MQGMGRIQCDLFFMEKYVLLIMGYVDGREIIFRKRDCSLPVMPGVTRALPLNMALRPISAQASGERSVCLMMEGRKTLLALKKFVLIPPGVRQATFMLGCF